MQSMTTQKEILEIERPAVDGRPSTVDD